MGAILRYSSSLMTVTVALLVAPTATLQCYAGLSSYGAHDDLPIAECDYGMAYCVKHTFPAVIGMAKQVGRGCDINGLCSGTGNGCFYDDFGSSELCCCNSNRCNDGIASTVHSLLLLLLLSVSLAIVMRHF